MDQLKLGEMLGSPESHTDYNVAGNGERDGFENRMDWAISSQAFEGTEQSVGSREGSTTTRMSPNNNSAHERPAPKGDDIVCSAVKAVEVGIKSPAITTKHGADRGNEHRQRPCFDSRSACLVLSSGRPGG